jgi:hypothetical protein
MRWKQSTALVLAAGALCGCSTLDDNNIFAQRYGPSPVLVAETVQNSVARQAAVVNAVWAGARGLPRDPATGQVLLPPLPADGDRERWYDVILTGFNVIDDACISYIDGLWIMERQKNRNSTILHAAGAAGAALISAAQLTPSTAAALLVLSQAFGFAGILNNAIFDTYLYTQNAATIKNIIAKTTLKYRTDLAEKFSENEITYPLGSPGAAYHHMREYLALCLPPTIQAQIENRLAGAVATTEKPVTVRSTISNTGIAPASRSAVRSGGGSRAIRPSTAINLD